MKKMTKIEQARRLAGYTQAEVAEMLGLNQMTISNWENGKTMPKVSKLYEMSKLFNVTMEDLMQG